MYVVFGQWVLMVPRAAGVPMGNGAGRSMRHMNSKLVMGPNKGVGPNGVAGPHGPSVQKELQVMMGLHVQWGRMPQCGC